MGPIDEINNVVDFETFKKKKEEEIDGSAFYKRQESCYKNIQETGVCKCDICTKKLEWANYLISCSQELASDYMRSGGEGITYGDLLEVFIMSTIKLREICTKGEP